MDSQEAIKGLEGQYSGISAAVKPHPTEAGVFTLGPLQMKVVTVDGQPMVSVGQGLATVESFISRRAGKGQAD